MTEWNWSAERRTAIGDVANQSLEYVAERLLESRKRAFEAEQAIRRVDEAYKAAADRLRSDLVQRTSERDAAREELKSLRYNLMAVTAQEKERTDQLAMAEAACRRDATALGVLQAELDALKAAHAWIKTSERLPELNTPVLGIDDRGDIDVLECVPAFRGGSEWQYVTGHHGTLYAVTDWMPLPGRPR